MYKLISYIPEAYLAQVKTALFEAGAGQFDGYSHCAWEVLGMGQFLPLSGANPAIGEVGKLEKLPEWRVEVIVPDEKLAQVMRAYKAAHPYEVPAYEVYHMVDVTDL